MSERSDQIKALAESYAEKFLAMLIGLPAPFTAVAVLVIFFFVGLGVRSLL